MNVPYLESSKVTWSMTNLMCYLISVAEITENVTLTIIYLYVVKIVENCVICSWQYTDLPLVHKITLVGVQASQFEFHGFNSEKLDHSSEVRAARLLADD